MIFKLHLATGFILAKSADTDEIKFICGILSRSTLFAKVHI